MKDSPEVTKALVDLYGADDWVMNLNFRMLMRLSGMRALPRDAKLLDCGCAMGHFLLLLQRNGFSNVYGADASAEMAEYARRLTSRPVFHCDVLHLSEGVETGAFDVVTAMNLQHHLGRETEWDAFVRECRKVIHPGGTLFIREPSATFSLKWLRRMARHPVFFKIPLLRGRLESLAEEREMLDYFLKHWPGFCGPCLQRNGFEVTKDFHWVGHRVVVSRART